MREKVVDLSKTLKKYSNKWLALDPDSMQVVAVGSTPKIVLERARGKGYKQPTLAKAPKDYGAYVL